MLKSAGNAFEVLAEQNPPHSINCKSGACFAWFIGIASMFSNSARQAIQGLMRFNDDMSEIGKQGGAI